MPPDTFNANFYITAATVIPVLYLALTLQGPTSRRLQERAIDESYKSLMLEFAQGKRSWLQLEYWGHGLLGAAFMWANVITVFSGFVAEPIAIVALYHKAASPSSAQIVLIIMIALLAVVGANQVLIIASVPKLADRLKESIKENQDEVSKKRDGNSRPIET